MLKKIVALFFCLLLIYFPFGLNVCAEECEHQESAWGVIVEATCTEVGYEYVFCSICGYRSINIISPALGHKEVVDEGFAPTCEEEGLSDGVHCSVCEEILVPQQTLEALGHSWDEGTEIQQPTCNDEGVKLFTCLNDVNHTKTEAVSALGHTPGAAATCSEPQICTVCKVVIESASGHNYEAVVTASGCLSEGYTTYNCSACGDSYIDNVTAPLGHSFSGWQTVKFATCIKTGLQERVCLLCGEVETRITEKVAHSFENGVCIGCGVILGDANADNDLDIRDLVILKGILVDTPEIYNPLLDMDVDGKLNAYDLIELKKLLFTKF